MRFAAVVLACTIAINPWGWDRFGPLRFGLIATIGFGVVAYTLWKEGVRPTTDWERGGWGLILGGTLVGAVFSDDRWHAFVGTPDRHFGLATWLLIAGLFIVTTGRREPVLVALSIGAATSGLYGLFELVGVDWFDQEFAGSRIGGPFGQPATLGAAMVLCVPAAMALAVTKQGMARSCALAAGALGLFALAASQSRAAWVGSVIAIAALVIIRRGTLLDSRHRYAGAIAAIAIVVIGLVTPLGARAWSLTDITDGVVAGRVDEWQVGSRALFASPAGGIIGLGPETYRVVFPEHIDEQYLRDHGADVITDRAHNSILDTALAGGIPAGAGIVILHVGVVGAALRRIRNGAPDEVALGVAAIAYIAQQLFFFPVVDVDPAFWIVAAFVGGAATGAAPDHRLRPAAVVAAVIAVAALIGGALDIAADHRVSQAVNVELEEAIDLVDDARALRPDSIRYDFISARLHTRRATKESLATAIERLDDGLAISPRDPALLGERARLRAVLAAFD